MQPARSPPSGNHRQQLDLEPAAAEFFKRFEHRGMFGRHADEVPAFLAQPLGRAANRQIIAFGSAAGEDDFPRRRADARGNPLPRIIDRPLRGVAETVRGTAGIAKDLGKIRQHRFDHAGIDSRGGVIVEVDHRG